LELELVINYEVIEEERAGMGPFRVTTTGYSHGIYECETGRELLVYHWHPGGYSHYAMPHLHLGATLLTPHGVIGPKTHLPTARISVEEVVRTCITEFGMTPLRDDWQRVLDLTEGVHKLYRSWSDRPPEIERSEGHTK
jgi:hypothetical protein